MNLQRNTYDDYADEYRALLQMWQDEGYSLYYSLVIPQMLDFLGDVAGRTVLDAGCGEGTLARLLAERGATVTAVDISPRLVGYARAQETSPRVHYLVQDLSQGLPESMPLFDLVVSNFVLNDVYDYRGYLATLGAVTGPGSRLVLSMNNPYSAVLREKAPSYFDSGAVTLYRGLQRAGLQVYYFHHTFEEYMTAFREAGFLLRSLSDLQAPDAAPAESVPVDHERIPFVIVLELVKPGSSVDEVAAPGSARQGVQGRGPFS